MNYGAGDRHVELKFLAPLNGQNDPAPYRAYLNDGSGHFTEATDVVFGDKVTGTGFDTEFRDLNGDGRDDVFMASRGTADRLLLGSR